MQRQQALMMGVVLFLTLLVCWGHYYMEKDRHGNDPEDKWAAPIILGALFISFLGSSLYPLTSIQTTGVGLPLNATFIAIVLGLLLPFALRNTIRNASGKSRFLRVICLLFITWLGSYAVGGLILCLNGALDRSAGTSHTTMVVNKIKNKSKVTSYEVHLRHWKERSNRLVVTVDRDIYDSFVMGDFVKVLVYDGFLGMEWIAKIEAD